MMLFDFSMLFGFFILLYLLLALALRSKKPKIPVWCIMAFSSFLVIVLGLLNSDGVTQVIDWDVILFLIGMFSLVGLGNSSGLFELISIRFVSLFKRRVSVIYASSLLFGMLAAFAVNDTVALMGPPIAYTIASLTDADPKFMFFLLTFSLTIGSVMTPIGNPQNLLIAIESGIKAPFLMFILKLTIPTILNLLITSYVLQKFFKIEDKKLTHKKVSIVSIKNRKDVLIAGIGILLTIFSLIINDILELLEMPHIKHRGVIPFIIAAGSYLLTSNPRKVISEVDWSIIVFFITMFITMEGIWRSGVLQPMLNVILPKKEDYILGIVKITLISLFMSQLLSNVPFVKIFIEYMKKIGYTGEDNNSWLTLAMSSTIAGNLTILGAASNIIILEVLESRMKSTITFKEFLKIGSVVSLINILVYLPFLLI